MWCYHFCYHNEPKPTAMNRRSRCSNPRFFAGFVGGFRLVLRLSEFVISRSPIPLWRVVRNFSINSKLFRGGSESQQVTRHAEAGNLAHCSARDVRLFTKLFTSVDIRNMDFDGWDPGRADSIPNGHAGMSIRSGIDDDCPELLRRLLNPPHQLPLVVRLPNLHFHTQLFGEYLDFSIDLIQCKPTVDF